MSTEHSQTLDWPQELARTDPADRGKTSKFSVGIARTERQLREEMGRMDVDSWRLSHVSGSGGDPGVVLRWEQDHTPYAVACDHWGTKTANMREIYMWVEETRKRGDRPVVTGDTDFAAARLMPPDADEPADPPPHEVLGVAPDASEAVIDAAAKARLGETHPDKGGSQEAFKRVQRAREKLLDD